MRKIWTIARREYKAMVATKAFVLSITLMPVLMLGGVVAARWFADVRDVSDKTIIVADGTGGALFDSLAGAASVYNAALDSNGEISESAESSDSDQSIEPSKRRTQPRIILERHAADSFSDSERVELSDHVRRGDLEAFVEIPAEITAVTESAKREIVSYYAQNAMLSPERRWVERVINDAVRAKRLAEFNIDPDVFARASAPVDVEPMGLVKVYSDGSVRGAEGGRNLTGLFVPFGLMMLMFMIIFMSAQPMMESLLEEKSERIAEVLLGAANPFELMAGKLLGDVAGSLTVVAIYITGGLVAAAYGGWMDFVPWHVLPWFLVVQIPAVLFYSSIFMAVGSAVRQLKDAQSMLLPVWLMLVCPLFVWLQIIREPNGAIATWLTFFPPATPLVLVMRLASESVIPLWQPLAAIALLLVCTLFCVFLAARIFRIGILWQGTSPKVSELVRWALTG